MVLGNWNEKLLLFRLQTKRDPDAFAALYDLYSERIYRFVFFKVGGQADAEDIVSESFLKTWNYINSHRDEEVKSFSGLLYRIARNCIVDYYRQKNSTNQTSGELSDDLGDGGKWYEELRDQVDGRQIIQAIKKLKQEYQEVITLRYVDELRMEEIAEITGKGKIAVRVTLHRALKKLKEIVEL
ncbi:MAG: hypothetical protein A3J93_01280 [Candidatus Magasanikbacteria bacterium RIFOXYC2_FULL_42_28]|uniref:RNA polymerase sigma factor n=1 Tax=Candidatus Magasanikbacteria bacterium RIFOXYC2_FULL_42_28 TaxID=1798704 RepID=A0A1F6NXV0_9BACT|nr:MAG: hypothetical protein A3J93_01280 [Candidatus Magasanikbacteria bacterium RIFOXYC2_FULL_42_28]